MKRSLDIANDYDAMGMMVDITSIFEGIAGLRIAQIKNQVLQAEDFFKELWKIYTQIRVDSMFRFGRTQSKIKVLERDLIIVITAEGGLSGDIDQKLIDWMLTQHNPANEDIIVIGHHGAVQLAQKEVQYKKYFKLPEQDKNINVFPIIQEVQLYRSTSVFYQTYVSLMVQDVKRIALQTVVQEQAKNSKTSDEIISELTYIFEPSTFAVIDHLERSMLQIALEHIILESKLAQFASRFRAMSTSHTKAEESLGDLRLMLNRSIRSVKDERLKEIINGLRKSKIGAEESAA